MEHGICINFGIAGSATRKAPSLQIVPTGWLKQVDDQLQEKN